MKIADEKSGWTLSLGPGKYDLAVHGGDDRFQLDSQNVTVTRAGQVKVKVIATAEGGRGKAEPGSPLPLAGEGPGVRVVGPAPRLAIAPFDEREAKEHQEAWAKHLGVPVEVTNSIGMKFVLIPPGDFTMGSMAEVIGKWLEEGERHNDLWAAGQIPSEGPQHLIRISKPFYMGASPVTQGDYERIMGTNPSAFSPQPLDAQAFVPPLDQRQTIERERVTKTKRELGRETGSCPVESVSWSDCEEFCRRLSAIASEQSSQRKYRVPTEAEWEYGCRVGTTTTWSNGDSEAELGKYAWFEKNSNSMTQPVAQKLPNAWGLLDMQGNVWQWCSDWYSARYYTTVRLSDE